MLEKKRYFVRLFGVFMVYLRLILENEEYTISGENGSGKSSIYWALYTLFQAAIKDTITDFQKYFKHPDNSEELSLRERHQ